MPTPKGFIPHNKGKTYEETYGIERATKLRAHLSNVHKGIPNPSKGKKLGKWSIAQRKKFMATIKTPESKRKRSESHIGNTLSDEAKKKLSKARKGRTYDDIYGKEKAQEVRHNQSIKRKGKTLEEIMGEEKGKEARKNMAIKAKKRATTKEGRENLIKAHQMAMQAQPSKPQTELYDRLLPFFPTICMEYPVSIRNDWTCFLDIAIPEKMLNVEYDGAYWHNENKDRVRDNRLESLGWKIIRINEKDNFDMKISEVVQYAL